MRRPLMILSILFLVIFVLEPGNAHPFRKTNWLKLNEILQSKLPKRAAAAVPNQWFTQKLDHSDVTNTKTWQQVTQVKSLSTATYLCF